ncbi:response regulator transcription factor [Streptomyces sp. NPDC050211]|uniref:response regulator transcription factor n=1 Tax=Streptomyces sp. NPDC050211 TaxID=3154932 RepID=UPI00341D45EC
MGVMIVDSHPSMRLALSTLVESHLRMPVVCSAATVEQAYAALLSQRPSIVVTELELGAAHEGAALCRRARSLPLRPRVMVFSGSSSPDQVAAALTSGADSFVHKSASVTELVDAIRQTACGRRVWLLGDTGRRQESDRRRISPLTPLTEREEQILALLLRRYTNDEIARELTLAGQTVKNHVSNILHKVGIRNRRELFLDQSALSA